MEASRSSWVPAAGLVWALERDGVHLTQECSGVRCFLPLQEAALWDLVSRRAAWDHLLRVLGLVTGLSPKQTERWVHRKLAQWVETGWLVPAANPEQVETILHPAGDQGA